MYNTIRSLNILVFTEILFQLCGRLVYNIIGNKCIRCHERATLKRAAKRKARFRIRLHYSRQYMEEESGNNSLHVFENGGIIKLSSLQMKHYSLIFKLGKSFILLPISIGQEE